MKFFLKISRVSHGFRLVNEDFCANFDNSDHFSIEQHFFEAAGAVVKIGLSIKPNQHKKI